MIKDIRDHILHHGYPSTLRLIQEHTVEVLPENLDKIQRNSWREVLDDFKKVYRTDQSFDSAATVVAGIILASKVPGDPLWGFLKGPPSTSKTIIVDAFAYDKEHCHSLSKLSAKALISGWKDPEDETADASIFPLLKNRTLLIKDYTAVLSMGGGAQDELYGILRDCYDGSVKIQYGNGITREYEGVYFSLVAAVTDVIQAENRSALGERFLKVEVIGDDYDAFDLAMAASNSVVKDAARTRNLLILGASIQNYMHSLYINPNRLPHVPVEFRTKIVNLALIIEFLRATVGRVGDDLLYRSRPAGGARVTKQLSKLGICLAILLKKPEVDAEVFQYILKVAKDTGQGFPFEVASKLFNAKPKEVRGEPTQDNPKGAKYRVRGMTTNSMVHVLQLPKTTTVRILTDLQTLGVVRRLKSPSEAGRDSDLWYLTSNFRSLWVGAGLGEVT